MRSTEPKRRWRTRSWVWRQNLLGKGRLRYAQHILGIACTGHGASLAFVGANGAVRSSVLDRWTGAKHVLLFAVDEQRAILNKASQVDTQIHDTLCYGFGQFPPNRVFEDNILEWFSWLTRGLDIGPEDIDLVVTSDSHFATCGARLGRRLGRWFPRALIHRAIEHHEVHQRQAFWQSGFEEAAVLTLDTCGENLKRLGDRKLSGTISVMNRAGRSRVLKELYFPESSAGIIYDVVTRHVGFRLGDEGKTMGLAPYGTPDLYEQLRPCRSLKDDGDFGFLDYRVFRKRLTDYVPERDCDEELNQLHMNVAFAGQALLQDIVSNAFAAALSLSGQRDLAYAGGIALNSVANELAFQTAQPRQLYVATNPGDTGHALGCALFGAYELVGMPPPIDELPEYLGPPYSDAEIEQAATGAGVPLERLPNPEQTIAQCLANGYIVGRFQGRAEFGPRALGNRSILCDPRDAHMKDYLNLRVKHREGFRPFAPTILEEHAAQWFEITGRSPYMLRVVSVRPERRAQVPAIIHVDGTARVQTVSERENPGYWRLIQAFHALTGVPIVLNTSFNVTGKPIVETPRDAIECFRNAEIDVLALGDLILCKQPLEHYLGNARPREAVAQ